MTHPARSTIDYFRRLGDLVARLWAAEGGSKDVFPEVAERALTDMPAARELDPAAVLEHVVRTPGYVNRGSSDTFGQPGVPVYLHEQFHVEVLFWFSGTTGIHEHAFQGAFHLLSGSSVHGSYRFDVTETISPQFLLGHTRLEHMELLRQGDTRRILPGRAGVHSLFHLDHPSTTIVVRTHNDPSHRPQLYYVAPHVAIDGFFHDRSLKLRQRCLSAAWRMDPDRLEPLTEAAIADADPMRLFVLLSSYADLEPDPERRHGFYARIRPRHGAVLDALVPSIESEQRQKEIHRRRNEIREPEHRFFLAMLLNCPDRADVLALARARVPDRDPAATVATWIAELARRPSRDQPSAPNVLGLELDDAVLEGLEAVLRGDGPLPEPLASSMIFRALAVVGRDR